VLIQALVTFAAAGFLLLHVTQFFLYPDSMNLRSSIAVCLFVFAAVFADRFADNLLSQRLLACFGLAGAGFIMFVLHQSSIA